MDYPIFSYLGYEMPVASDSEWLRANGEPNGMTVDDIHIECDALPSRHRRAHRTLTLTDGASTLDIRVVQSRLGHKLYCRQRGRFPPYSPRYSPTASTYTDSTRAIP